VAALAAVVKPSARTPKTAAHLKDLDRFIEGTPDPRLGSISSYGCLTRDQTGSADD
jgi:hypothetical protein